jgi:hypothetical protein
MHVINIAPRLSPTSSQALNASVSVNSSDSSFQIELPAQTTILSSYRTAPTGSSSSLGSQMMSALLQLQAENADTAQMHGHGGGGGGGHHGNMKIPQGLEAEEATESEEAARLRARKRLLKKGATSNVKETDETEESNLPEADVNRPEESRRDGDGQTL